MTFRARALFDVVVLCWPRSAAWRPARRSSVLRGRKRRTPATEVTFNRDIAPIIFRSCSSVTVPEKRRRFLC